MSKRLAIKHPQVRIEKRYEVPIPERWQLKPKEIPASVEMKKVGWWERLRLHAAEILEDAVSSVVENVFWLKWVFVALLFVMSVVVWLNKVQEYIDEQLSKPIQKMYEMIVEFGFSTSCQDESLEKESLEKKIKDE